MNWSVDEIIPQKAPFVFIDTVVEVSEKDICTRFTIQENTTLLCGDTLSEAALVENIAQSAAALEGCSAKMRGEAVKVGFIGAVKKLSVVRPAKKGEVLTTKLSIVSNAIGVNIAEGKVFVDDELIAGCTLNIFLKED